MSKYRMFLLIFILVFSVTTLQSLAVERQVDQENKLLWLEAKNYTYDSIVGEDAIHIFVKSHDDLLVFDKALNEKAELIEAYFTLDPETYSRFFNREIAASISRQRVEDSRIEYTNSRLTVDGYPMVDMSSYEEADRAFYQNNDYDWRPIEYYIDVFEVRPEQKIYSVMIYTNTYIPAPYTPVDFETYLVEKDSVTKLTIDSHFKMNEVVEFEGNLILNGTKRQWKYYESGYVYSLNKDGKIVNLNETLQSEKIELLELIEEQAYFSTYEVDQELETVVLKKTYVLDATLNGSEVPDLADIYKSKEGQIYEINKNANVIRNTSMGTEKDTSQFMVDIALYQELDTLYKDETNQGYYSNQGIKNLKDTYDLEEFQVIKNSNSNGTLVSDHVIFIQNYFSSDEDAMTFKIFDTQNLNTLSPTVVRESIKNFYYVPGGVIYPGEYYKLLKDGRLIIKEGLDRYKLLKILKLGDVIGAYKKSVDFYSVNGHLIPVYLIDGNSYICIEDLKFCGFKMVWDAGQRTTRFTSNNKDVVQNNYHMLEKQGDLYFSDIQIYVEEHKLPSYNMGGYSLVCIDDFESIRVE